MTEISPPHQRPKTGLVIINILLIASIICAIIWGVYTYAGLNRDLYTEDAQVEEYINPVNTRISGYIKEVRYTDHQRVKKGDTLIIIDDHEFQIQLEQAEAGYLSALASKKVSHFSVTTVSSNTAVLNANIKAIDARIWNAEQNYHRFENLLAEGAATQQQFDQVKTEYLSLAAQRKSIEHQRVTTGLSADEFSQRLGVNNAEIKRAHASLEIARLNLSYTVITAPYDGVTGRRYVQEGQLIQPGQTALSFVRTDNKWVIANYKETDIRRLHVGQRMTLNVDGLDGKKFTGIISAISEATGTRYSAIPVDNSTGNFIKVRQRIPVRIEFLRSANNAGDINLLIAGMNVEVRSEGR